MKNNYIVRSLRSVVFIPMVAASITLQPTPNITVAQVSPEAIVTNESKIEIEKGKSDEILKAEGLAIDSYFKSKKMPLAGNGLKMAIEADKHNLDWRVIAAISIRESTGGKFACKKAKNNPFGWGSCKIGFSTMDKAIETVTKTVAGNNKNVAHFYQGDLLDRLKSYNGDVVKDYPEEVLSIMEKIGPEDITTISEA